MLVKEAFEILRLSPEADEGELKKAYRDLTRVTHPDMATGNAERQAELNEAYQVASAAILGQNPLVSLHVDRSIQRFERSLYIERAARQASELAQKIGRRGARPLQQLKYVAWTIGVMSAGVAWFGDNLFPALLSAISTEAQPVVKQALFFNALVLAVAGGMLQLLLQRLQHSLDSYMDELDDPRFCATELSEILGYRDANSVLEHEITPSVTEPFHGPVSPPFGILNGLLNITQVDRRRLLILKSVGHGLLLEVRPEQITPDAVVQYEIKYQPSGFRPSRQPTEPMNEPMSINDARWMTLSGCALFLLLAGVTSYLAIVQHTLWSIAPGFFAFIGLVFALSGIGEWKGAKGRAKETPPGASSK